MNTYKLVIGYNPNQYFDGSTEASEYLFLDTINERTIDGSNTTPSQPMQNGDSISDHTYRNPNEMSISGEFGLNSSQVYNLNNTQDYVNQFTTSGTDRLTRIEETFEGLKKSAYLCTLTFMGMPDTTAAINSTIGNNSSIRFKIRKNMQLVSFTWTEKLNSLKFSLKFKEVIMVNQQEYYNLPADARLVYKLMKVTDLPASSLSVVLTDPNNTELYELVIKQLYEKGYIEESFLRYVSEQKDRIAAEIGYAAVLTVISGVAIGLGIGIAMIAAGTTLTAVTATIFPVGTVIAIAVGIAAFIGCISNIVSAAARSSKVIRLVNSNPTEGLEKLQSILDSVKNAMSKIDTNVLIYTFNSDEPQQTLIRIGGKTYVIEANENNITNSPTWNFKVLDTNLKPITTAVNNNPPIVENISQLTDSSGSINFIWFNDANVEYEVYLVNPSLDLKENKNNKAAMDNVKSKLSTYSIWVSKGNISDNIGKFMLNIADILASEGYE